VDGAHVSTLALLVTQSGPTIDLGGKGASTSVQILLLLTLMSILPGALLMLTGFTRILIVLGFLRNALGTPSTPPNQVLVGISLFLAMFVMAPTLKATNEVAVQPYLHKDISLKQAIDRGQEPFRAFMFKQTRDSDLALFVKMADIPQPKTRADIPTYVLIPAFLISELKTAFQIGFLIYLPFLIIDMVISSTLMSMGMMMLPPVLISLPFKILLFVLVDGWSLVVAGLVQSFHT
jgi:flagellar biosynthesis protein FliP